MVDARIPLPELEELGFKARGDGSYTFDSRTHPEWQPLEQTLLLLSDPAVLPGLEGTLQGTRLSP